MMARTTEARRVAITGLGLVSPLGTDLGGALEALGRGEKAPRLDRDGISVAAVPASFDPKKYFKVTKSLKLADRKTRFAVAAATMALQDSGIALESGGPEDAGVILGVGTSDLLLDELSRALAPDPEQRSATDIPFFSRRILGDLNPLWLLVTLPNMASAHVAIQLEARGPNNTIMTDCIAGAQAVGESFQLIRNGDVDLVVCGGTDSGIGPLSIESHRQAGLFVSPRSETAHGEALAIGEGAGMLVLEEMESALSRRARIYAEVVSYSCRQAGGADTIACNLGHTMRDSLRQANWEPDDLELVCPATSCPGPGCVEERTLLEAVFPDVEKAVDFKSHLGHALAASGAIDVVLLLASLEVGGRQANVLCNSLGFSGQAVTLCVGPA